jgi:hypothetical protein
VNFYVVLEKASVKQSKTERFKDAEQYLANSRMSLGHSTMGWTELENRWSKLHKHKFLSGAGCSAKKIWPMAQEQIGLDSQPASHQQIRYAWHQWAWPAS